MDTGKEVSQEQFNQRSKELTDVWAKAIIARKAKLLLEQTPVELEMVTLGPVLAIRAPLITLLEAGRIPDGLTPFVLDLFIKGNSPEKPEEATARVVKAIEERWSEYIKTLDVVWLACVVAPIFTVQESPGLDEHKLSDVPLADKIALFNWCQGVTNYLAAFRVGQDGTARVVATESSVSEVHTGGTSGDSTPGESVAVVASEHGNNDLGKVRRRKDSRAQRSNGQPAQA